MIVFFAVGNNEQKYLQTKHNIGRIALERMASILTLNFNKNSNFYTAKITSSEIDVYLVYSTGYMNNSGQALQSFFNYYKINPKQATTIILQDDSDQIEGKVKLVLGGGTAGHRGLESIYEHLQIPVIRATRDQQTKTKIDLWRLKIGIRPAENKLKSETFVLKNISQIDEQTLLKVADYLVQQLPLIASKNLEKVQNYLNTGV